MGVLQAVRDALDTSKADQEKAQEQLDFLLDMAKSQLALFKTQLIEELSGVATGDDPVKIVGEPVAWTERYNCNVSKDVSKGISDAVDDFFGGSSDDVKNGFKHLIQVGLKTILGSDQMGQQEQQQTFITMQNNAIVRLDTKVWRYNFKDNSIIGTIENAMCYTFCTSVVDYTKVSEAVLVYEISQMLGGDLSAVESYIEKLKEVYKVVSDKTPDVARAEFASAVGVG